MWAAQMLLLGCHLLSAPDRMAGEDPVEQKNLGSLMCHHEIQVHSAQSAAGIVSWDVLEKQGALLPPPAVPGHGSAQGAGTGTQGSA